MPRSVVCAVPCVCALFFTTGCFQSTHSNAGDRAIAAYHAYQTDKARSAENSSGGQPVPAPNPLTADLAVQLAKAASPRLAELKARLSAASAKVLAEGVLPNPELRVSQLRADQVAANQAHERTALRVFIPRPGEIDSKTAVARAAEAEADAALRAGQAEIEAEVRWLFDDVLLLESQLAASAAVAKTRLELSTRTHAKLQSSEATLLDDALAELSAVHAHQDEQELQADRKAALAALLVRIGADPNAEVNLQGDAKEWPPPALPSDQTLVETALRYRPEVHVAAAGIDAAFARAAAVRAKRYPWFTFLEVGYEVGPNIPAGQGWTFQGGIDLPIFTIASSAVDAADSAQSAAQQNLTSQAVRIAGEVKLAAQKVRAAEALVTDLKTRALPVVDKAGQAVKRALETGEVDLLRALTVDERRAVMELRLIVATRNYRARLADLRRTVAGPIPRSSEVKP
ncbi:MAG: TolC family protein [Polyangiaceae bacterium]|nr:TolC family protein [Polyangiaceae bacterium]